MIKPPRMIKVVKVDTATKVTAAILYIMAGVGLTLIVVGSLKYRTDAETVAGLKRDYDNEYQTRQEQAKQFQEGLAKIAHGIQVGAIPCKSGQHKWHRCPMDNDRLYCCECGRVIERPVSWPRIRASHTCHLVKNPPEASMEDRDLAKEYWQEEDDPGISGHHGPFYPIDP